MSILHSKQGTGEATAALLHDVLRLADMLQLMWKQLKARRWRKTDICAVLWLHAQGQQALILNLNLCLNRLTACVWHVYSESDEENSSCVCVCVSAIVYVCVPQLQSSGRGGSDSPLLLLWLLLGPPWPSHRHAGSKRGPLTPPSCLCVRVCAPRLALTYLSKHALLAWHSTTLVIRG